MAGHIDDTHFETAGERKPGKAEFNGHLSGFFFGQAVRVDAGQGMNQRGFTMVDMTGCTDNEQSFSSRLKLFDRFLQSFNDRIVLLWRNSAGVKQQDIISDTPDDGRILKAQ